ncbi:unnamed protein product [Cuscuta campestris]|uniref:Retrotransposon gag domain-containing protein n=1 Tax=Cuscuta campestris TaxID=132261 RepID=A0A484KV30_9ASTE|nr:unnamed protein product [Cuscuta campestris]
MRFRAQDPIPEDVHIIQPQLAANFMNFLQQMAGAYVPPPPPPPPPAAVVTIEKLRKNGAEEFLDDQIADPMIAKQWFERTIRDSAYEWWKRVEADVPEPVQWATFDRLFHEEYVPEHFVEAKREEFLKFTQGELTLPEYRQKFDELAGFGQDLVPTVEKRCKRFVEGLRLDLSTHLIISPRSDSNALYKNVLDLNAALIKKAEFEQAQGASATPSRPPPPQKAGTSSKRHPGECSYTLGLCLGCGQAEYFRKDCPKNPGEAFSTAPAASAPAAQPAQSQKSAAASSQPKRQASSAQGGKARARTYAMRGRMDWLTANQAVVDCGAHTVRLRVEDSSDVLIHAELLPKAPIFISYIHARRLIRKKCEAFLCTVRDTCQEAPSRGDIPTPTLQQQIASAQSSEDFCIETVELVSRGEKLDFAVRDGILYYRERMLVPAGEVSMLRRYRSDPSHVIPADTVTLDENLTYEEEPIEILAREVRQLRNKTIPLVKVLWRSHTVEEATWETEESMQARYHIFSVISDQIHSSAYVERVVVFATRR